MTRKTQCTYKFPDGTKCPELRKTKKDGTAGDYYFCQTHWLAHEAIARAKRVAKRKRPTTRVCQGRCGLEKPLSAFAGHGKVGREKVCKECFEGRGFYPRTKHGEGVNNPKAKRKRKPIEPTLIVNRDELTVIIAGRNGDPYVIEQDYRFAPDRTLKQCPEKRFEAILRVYKAHGLKVVEDVDLR